MALYLHLQLLILIVSSEKIPQLPLSNEIFNLLLEVKAFIGIMPMVSMETTILVPIALIGISLHFLWPLQRRLVLNLHENLLKRDI